MVFTNFPKSVIFILLNEFAERFAYYGIKTILVLYMRMKLNYSDDSATTIFHIFISFVYFFPLAGAIMADSWLGKFATIFLLSIIYAFGSVIISFGAIPILKTPVEAITVIGMLMIAVGSGGIKPCVAAFGGDQYKLPKQAVELVKFFSIFYFTMNAGSLISTLLTPTLREDVHCFGQEDCYFLAFAVPAILMIISIVIFLLGKPFYTITKPTGNMVVLVSKCIGNAIVTKFKERKTKPRSYWLEYAEPKYGKTLVRDVSILLKILVLFLPLPFFWALFDQQSSRWILQATRMNGRVGSITIKPDQLQMLSHLLILVFIPFFQFLIYPILAVVGIKRPLQKLTIGGILAAVAIATSGFIELKLESLEPVIPRSGQAQFHLYNLLRCPYRFKFNENLPDVIVPPHVHYLTNMIDIPKYTEWRIEARINGTEPYDECPESATTFVDLKERQVLGLSLYHDTKSPLENLELIQFEDNPIMSKSGVPLVRFITSHPDTISMKNLDSSETINIENFKRHTVKPGLWRVTYDYQYEVDIKVRTGGVYSYVFDQRLGNLTFQTYSLRSANSVHMLWQIPQYVVMAAGEVMFSITGLEFSYSQAPVSMKSVLQACWLLTIAVGNLMVVFLTSLKFFDSQAIEFFLFAVLMIIDMGIFILLAMRYKYVEYDHGTEAEMSDEEKHEADLNIMPSESEEEAYSDNEDVTDTDYEE
ncbi:hypothetical protein DMENIID0001_097660 [Sergentomyia squamirostris]